METASEPKVAGPLKAEPSRAPWCSPFAHCGSAFFSLAASRWQFLAPALSSELNRRQPNVISLPVRETKENDLQLPLPGCPADSSAHVGVAPCCKASHDVAVIGVTKRTRVCMKTVTWRCWPLL